MLDISFDLDCDNLNDDDVDFLLAAAEHTNAPPVGLQDSETILKPVKKKTQFEELLKNYLSFMLHISRTETKIHCHGIRTFLRCGLAKIKQTP